MRFFLKVLVPDFMHVLISTYYRKFLKRIRISGQSPLLPFLAQVCPIICVRLNESGSVSPEGAFFSTLRGVFWRNLFVPVKSLGPRNGKSLLFKLPEGIVHTTKVSQFLTKLTP